MHELPPGREIANRTQRRHECMELRLVLSAAGIAAETIHQDGWWLLVVHSDDLEKTKSELQAYRQENPVSPDRANQPYPTFEGAGVAVLTFAFVVIVFAIMDARSTLGLDWQSIGCMDAGEVVNGQWWRCLTALTLHLDPGHLIANLVFGTVFGLIAGRILGGGIAWLAIVIAGGLGNLINAYLRFPSHASVGASTAVFAALGLIVVHALRRRGSGRDNMMKRWSPLIGGVVLFAFTGVGSERTDVVAHAAGFLGGMLLGWIGCQAPQHWLANARVQLSAGLAAIVLVTIAWTVGIVEL